MGDTTHSINLNTLFDYNRRVSWHQGTRSIIEKMVGFVYCLFTDIPIKVINGLLIGYEFTVVIF